ncbi:uncharacterized protein LOC106134383 [Amyelois transitella]|uniref:uncharacterized protein LOC106134383 n=1 Tax=Amyelois transitella TaxID=680683 RepID=UPI00298FE451|nr:uncharacterized protein LOC106134383 [Amyelois transitella]
MFSKIREFGLDHCTLPNLIANSCALLRFLSLNVDPTYKKNIPILCKLWTVFLALCYLYVYLISMIWFVFFKCAENGDLISATVMFATGMASELSNIKLLYMFVYRKYLTNMISEYLIHDAKKVSNHRFMSNLLKVLRRVKKRAMIFWLIIMGNGVVYMVKPLLLPGRHLMEDMDYLFGLDPILETPNYEIAFFLSLGAVIFACHGTATVSTFLIIVSGYIEAQMISLSEELLNIWDDAQEYYENIINTAPCTGNSEDLRRNKEIILNKYVKEHLQDIVANHAVYINFRFQIENVFRSAIAIGFGFLTVSLISEFFGGIENTYLVLPYAMVQVIIDCIIGQKLSDSGDVFQKAVYESKWENFDATNMKTVKMILMISQKGMTLSVGGLKPLNYFCLMNVFRMIYSTYAALTSAVKH